MGVFAGQSNITGQQNTLLGYNADVRSGNLTNAAAIGANAKVSVSNAIVLGDTIQNTKVGIGTTYPQFPLDVKGIINIRGNGTLKFSHLTNPSYQNGQTDQVLTVNANGETVLAKVSKLDEVTELKAQVAELTKQLLELKQRMEQLERGGKLIVEKE